MESLRQFYAERIKTLTSEVNRLNRKSRIAVVLELLSIALTIGCIIVYGMFGGGFVLRILPVLTFFAYLFIRKRDSGQTRLIEQKESLCEVYQNELSYLDGDFSPFHSGEQYIDPYHQFTYDLDIFGPQSLFHRINRTATSGGSDFLASELAETRVRTLEEIEARHEAISELTNCEEVRNKFIASSNGVSIDTYRILTVLHDIQQVSVPRFTLSVVSLVAMCCSMCILYLLIGLTVAGYVTPEAPILWGVFQCVMVFLLCSRPLRYASKIVPQIHRYLRIYINLINQITASDMKSQELRDIINQLRNEHSDADKSFRQLYDIANSLDMRNEMWVFLSNVLFCGDYFLVRKFIRWQDRYMKGQLEDWIDAVSHFDALASMATFRYNERETVDVKIVDDDKVVYEARGLYHPFLGQKAIRNDFTIVDQNYYIVTGANMAGKSTFLRSIGINYVLATCGMPVFADELCISLFSLFSSMRTTDDLAHGISYFNAELLRLQQLIESCKENQHTLIILDEILKGTNSLDKLNGSRLFLKSVSSLPVTGVIATHDLELSKMQQDNPDRFHNYCFEIQLSDEITYTYKLSEGIAQNQNATYLLKNILKTINAD